MIWDDLVTVGVPLAEKVIRTVVVYLAILFLLRLAGKRELAQLNTFDLVVMLLLSNVVQNAVIGPDNSVLGGLIGAAVLLGANALVVRTASHWPRLNRLLEGEPTVLARDGHYDLPAIRRLGIRRADIAVAVKKQGGDHITDTELVTLEPGGRLLVRLRSDEEDASAGDIAMLHAQLTRIERRLDELSARPPERP
ncbi:DUF421 domain-containing protein [Nonomuraea sp. NPDC050556]|uniref:DUF421 domain-containing protein n=1 Tax=Nonomuraea sp. NPDC050556 TaxID=3364369 RepID=UPI0037B96472